MQYIVITKYFQNISVSLKEEYRQNYLSIILSYIKYFGDIYFLFTLNKFFFEWNKM